MEQILAFGNERFPIDPLASRPDREIRSRIMLSRALNLRTVVAFIGSGCSAPLGYPVWRGLVTGIVEETIARVSPSLQARFRGIHARLASPASSVTTRSLMYYLSLCQQHLHTSGEPDRLHAYIAAQILKFEQDAKWHRDGDYNPYNTLKDLPIRRFVTTNYDQELVLMLRAKFDDDRKIKSFTQKSHGDLAGFAVVGLKGLTDSIFHCHGSAAEPETIVASEADYQEWYLTQRNATATTFRQNLDLVLSSNPVLFIGFGMEDDDLLRPLRVFHADDPERKDARLLFALSESSDDPAENDWMDSIRVRYGVNFLRYNVPPTDDPAERGRRLCGAIKQLESEWHKYREQWWQKPPIRKVSVPVAAHKGGRPKKPYQHYSVRLSDSDELAPTKTKDDLDILQSFIRDPATRVVLVTGDGGSGKSWRVLNLLERLKKDPGRFKDGIFFWSSYYADDWLTGLDRALSYFQQGESARPRRLDRFRDCLENGEHLVVLDGFERLLRETENSKIGSPYGRNVRELLDIMVRHEEGKTRSTMILTTRLIPDAFQQWFKGPGKEGDPVRHFGVRRLTTKDLRNGHAFRGLSEQDIGRICSLCGGHSYALLLAMQYLRPHTAGFEERFATFRREISRRAPDSRIPEIIKLAIGAVDDENEKLASKLLDRLAVFMSPIDSDTSQVCFEEALKSTRAAPKTATRKTVIDALLKSKLVLQVTTEPQDRKSAHELVTVHPVVRSHVFYKSHGVVREVTPTFTLTGFTSGNLACHPGDGRGKEQVERLFDALCTRALDSRSHETRRSLARAAFGVMRSRMESNSVPRWTSYDRYLLLGLRLLFLIKSIAWGQDTEGQKETWDYQDRALGNEKQSLNGILYSDELAWLYNDIGLALGSEGSMADAYSLWEQGFEINRVTDSEEEGGQYMVQSHLHMSHLFIELGRLPRAAQFLATTARANAIYGDPDFAGRILGYSGLLAHLAGNVDEAAKLYAKAVQQLAGEGRHNLRAESLFHRHWADLLLARKDYTGAEERAEIALSLAREGDFPDLEAYARKTRAHVWREMGKRDPKDVRAEYVAAMQHAVDFGIRRLQADIHSELARLALQVGDWETSRIRAMESLKLANELSLGLRRTHGLIVLGMAMEAGGNRDLAVSYYEHALRMSKLQGYHLRGREAEQQLLRLGVPMNEFDGAGEE